MFKSSFWVHFHAGRAAAILTKVVTSLLFRLIQALVNTQCTLLTNHKCILPSFNEYGIKQYGFYAQFPITSIKNMQSKKLFIHRNYSATTPLCCTTSIIFHNILWFQNFVYLCLFQNLCCYEGGTDGVVFEDAFLCSSIPKISTNWRHP